MLAEVSATPDLDSELLLAKVLNVEPVYLHAFPEKELDEQQNKLFLQFLRRRVAGEPVAYILESQGFWDIELKVTKDVLIPRPETELLIEIILEKFSADDKLRIADLGTGSGAIALTLAKARPSWQIIATDISVAALRVAKENAQRLHLSNVQFCQGEWCDALAQEKFSVIVSNPPYINQDDPHLLALNYEPQAALVAGKDGLDAIRKIIVDARAHLLSDGMLLLEHGYDQAAAVKNLFQQAGYFNIKNYRDHAGHERASGATYK